MLQIVDGHQLDRFNPLLKAFLPAAQIAAGIFGREFFAFAVDALQIEDIALLARRRAPGEDDAISKFAQTASEQMQRRRKIDAHTAARLIPGHSPAAPGFAAMTEFAFERKIHRGFCVISVPEGPRRRGVRALYLPNATPGARLCGVSSLLFLDFVR